TLRELGLPEGLPALPEMEFVMMHDARMPAAVEFAAMILDETAARAGAGTRNRA
ncbi:LysR family transcriptional regulator, partial [Burkholderia cenocepacia]|nr:LysR family transcriptional regulator [Burkholderia cenocepacia]